MARTFMVRINLDDMCAELDTLRPDQHAEWLAGFRAGSRGKVPNGWDGPRLMGADFGMAAFQDAERFRAQSSEAGHRSADARRAKYGSASPQRPSNDLRTTFEGASNDLRTTPEPRPEQNAELSNIQYPISNIQAAAAAAAPADMFDNHPPRPPIRMADRPKTMGDFHALHPRIYVDREERGAWEALLAEYEWDIMDHAYKTIEPTVPKGKRVHLSQLTGWLAENTRKIEQ